MRGDLIRELVHAIMAAYVISLMTGHLQVRDTEILAVRVFQSKKASEPGKPIFSIQGWKPECTRKELLILSLGVQMPASLKFRYPRQMSLSQLPGGDTNLPSVFFLCGPLMCQNEAESSLLVPIMFLPSPWLSSYWLQLIHCYIIKHLAISSFKQRAQSGALPEVLSNEKISFKECPSGMSQKRDVVLQLSIFQWCLHILQNHL